METLTYIDPVRGCSGHLVYDGRACRLAAGGCRVRPGLTASELAHLAGRMSLKQRVLGLNVDGAKCGLDYDPGAADVADVLRRFLAFLRPELSSRFSMGCDMGTRFEVLQELGRDVGVPSIKYAVRAAQELDDDDFWQRMRVLDARVEGRTVSERRAGHALAHATLAAATRGGYRAPGLRVGLQGFGNLGRAAAQSLAAGGARIVALADEFGCVARPEGLDVTSLLATDWARPVPTMAAGATRRPGSALFDLALDALVLAGGVNELSGGQLSAFATPLVVVGANGGLAPDSQRRLEEAGVVVIPDFVGGAGGSASMEALFGPDQAPAPEEVLSHIAVLTTELVSDLLGGAGARGVAASAVAQDIAAAALVSAGDRPYGKSPYAMRGVAPRGHRGRMVADAPALAKDKEGTA